MAAKKSERLQLLTDEDVVKVRHLVRKYCGDIGFSLVDSTKVITAASELGRNTLIHGGGGDMLVEALDDGVKSGIRLTFSDKGPGIANMELALRGGYTTSGGIGLGLSGSKRLMSEFQIDSKAGEGTQVVVIRWKK